MLFKVKGGQELPVEELNDHDLKWYANAEKVSAAKRAAAQAEVALRQGGGAGASRAIQPARQQAALAQRPPDQAVLGAAMGDAIEVTKALADMAEKYHLVSPQTQVDCLPDGCGVSLSLVLVDKKRETYKAGNKLGLAGTALKRIAAAAGIDWDPVQSRRLDDGSDPHYCHFRAVGRVRNFDGTWRTLTGEVEIDTRDGASEVATMSAKQLAELRRFILRHAESKAKNRAIADLGVKRNYDEDELDKPFAVAKLTWTGRSDNPEVQRVFAQATAANMLQGSSALYGAAPQLGPGDDDDDMPPAAGHPPPPVGTVVDAEGEDVPPSARGAAADGGDMDRGADPNAY